MKQFNSELNLSIASVGDFGYLVGSYPGENYEGELPWTSDINDATLEDYKRIMNAAPDGTVFTVRGETAIDYDGESILYGYPTGFAYKYQGEWHFGEGNQVPLTPKYVIEHWTEIAESLNAYKTETTFKKGAAGYELPFTVNHFVTLDNGDMILLIDQDAHPFNTETAKAYLKKQHGAPVLTRPGKKSLYTEYDDFEVVKDEYFVQTVSFKQAIDNKTEFEFGCFRFKGSESGSYAWSLPMIKPKDSDVPPCTSGGYQWSMNIVSKDNFQFGLMENYYDDPNITGTVADEEFNDDAWEIFDGKKKNEPTPEPTYIQMKIGDELGEMQKVYFKSPNSSINILVYLRHLPEATTQDGKTYNQIMKLKSKNFQHECEIGYMSLGGMPIIVDTNLETGAQTSYYGDPFQSDENQVLFTTLNDYDYPPSEITEDLGGLEAVYSKKEA